MNDLIFKQTSEGNYKVCITGADGFDVCIATISMFNPLSFKDRELLSDMQSLGIQAQKLSFKLAGFAPPPKDSPKDGNESSTSDAGRGSLNNEFSERVKRQQFTNVQFSLFVETLQKAINDRKGLRAKAVVSDGSFSPDPTFRFGREPYAMMHMIGVQGRDHPQDQFKNGTRITVSSNGGSDTHLEIAAINLRVGPELPPVPELEELLAALSEINTIVGLDAKARVDSTIYPSS